VALARPGASALAPALQKKAVAIAVKDVSGRRRWSKLREWLNPASFSIPRSIGA
jgi:hypothetical protein